MTQSTNATKRKFFVSRAGADAAFGAEIGRILEEAGYEVVLQQWDFANRNFMERIHTVLAEGARVVALLSPEYLRSDHCQAEWQNTIAGDPLNNESRLILLRVAECEPGGLLSGLAYWDLLPICESSAMVREVVLDAVAEEHRGATPSGPYWRAPQTIVEPEAIRPVPGFSGRDEDLGAIAAALRDDGGIAIVHGLGGVGKSSVARQYAWRNRDRYAVVWWLNAENEDGIVDGFLRLGALFTRGLDRLADRRAAAQQVTGSMLGGFAKPVLLIFDNLEDERLLRSWQPRTGACILVTSRNASWGGDTALISLDVWPRETALTYVRRESGRTDFSEAEANEIVNSLGALPLALSHAAATLRSMRMLTPARYLERIGEHLANAPRYAEYPRSVFATFQTAVADAEQQAPGAAALFCFAAHFAPDAIPDELFRQSADLYPEKVRAVLNEDRIDEALGALDQMSLLSFAVASRTFSMHRLVQLVGRELAGEAKLEWGRSAVSVAETLFPAFSSNVQFATLPQCARLLAHARAALDTLPDDEEHVVAGRLADRCAYYLREEGNLKSAEPLHERVVKIFERAYGVEHPETASAFNNLAELRWAQGRFEEAASLYGRALAIYEKTLGPDHAEVATTLNNLGLVHDDRGNDDEAESLLGRALAIWEKTLGPDHAHAAISLSNLASVYAKQGRYEEAASLRLRTLEIRERAFGADHPDVAVCLNNLGYVYEKQGRYEEAESLLTRGLAIWEKTLGLDHPTAAPTMKNLGIVYGKQGRYEEAVSLLVRALALREKALGAEHPEVANTLNDLAEVYGEQGRYDEAESLLARALAIRESVFGPEHALTKQTREALSASRTS